MYCEFFGFSEKPFTVTPNPNYVFLSSIHQAALGRLSRGLAEDAGLIVLTGEVGTGKTTLLRTVLTRLDPNRFSSALIFNQYLTPEQLLVNILREFAIQIESDEGTGSLLRRLHDYLLEQSAIGRTAVLVIDEAQNLSPDLLEQIRQISDLQCGGSNLLQIVLAGQPELDTVLSRQELRHLKQRIAVRCHLVPMSFADTLEYVNHRLTVADNRLPNLFPRASVKKIYQFSRGVPRLINIVCEQALVMAWTQESRFVPAPLVRRVIEEMRPSANGCNLWGRIINWVLAGR